MKKKLLLKLVIAILLLSFGANAQIAVPFSPRLPGNFLKLKGDATLIGNTIVNVAPANNPSQANNAYNGTGQNNGQNMEYINVDSAGNPTLFSSSSAKLTLPSSCSRVKYAGLYWFAVYPNGRSATPSSTQSNDYLGTVRTEDWFNMKFKVPGGAYVDLTADTAADPVGSEDDIIFNGYNAANVSNSFTNAPYVCYKNVTSLVQAAANPNGDYYAANVRATVGNRDSGCSGGWMLVVIYEDLNLTSKYISTFDGYASVNGNTSLSYPVNGFNTIPTGPVKAKIGVAALEGDLGLTGDRFRIKANSIAGFTDLSQGVNTATNFFNSTVSSLGVIMPNRNPASTNTLGTDIDLIDLNNPGNTILPNNETGAQLQLRTTGDVFGALFSLFDVDIIEPIIPLIKIAEDLSGNNISGQALAINQTFYYSLNFDNTGNDNATSFTIEDTLPVNIVFPPGGNGTPILPTDLILPPGVTYTYNPVTKKFVFTIPNSLVTTTAPSYTIKIKVRAPLTCAEVVDACSNVIINQAYATYTGITSGLVTSQSPSNTGYNTCTGVTPGATNYLVDINLCTFPSTAVLCGTSVVLTAANGYTTYQWYDSNNNPIGNTQSITVYTTGTYHVEDSAPNPCASITQVFNVVNFTNAITTNPVIPFADQVVICPNNGVQLPKIFLCGTGDSQLIQSGITNASSIVWQQLAVGSCPAVTIADCANTNSACTWNQVGTGANYTANTPGQFRIIVNYQNGCFRIFYFNVYQNILSPTFVVKDIVCSTIGSITVNNIPAGYEYSLSPTGPFQTSNLFNISTASSYTVYIRQIGVTNGCLFNFTNIVVLSKPFTVNVVKTDKICNNGYGSINVQINNVNPQYSFQISQGATVVSTFGPSATNYHVFSNLNPGTYTITATTQDGCLHTENVTIQDYNLSVSAALVNNINCNPGSINLTATGGLSGYNYAIYSYNGVQIPVANYVYQTDPTFTIPVGQAGNYQFLVIDGNNCTSLSNVVNIQTEVIPTITATPTNVTCFNASNGILNVTTTPTNGYTITYSIDGTTFQSSNQFIGLAPGNYTITVKYTKGVNVCTYTTTATITQPLQLVGQAQVVQQLTCTLNGSIQAISVSGGTSPYQYSINGITFQNSNVFSNLTAGTYTITIKDSKNCIAQTNTITFTTPLPPTDLTFSNTNITCPSLTSNLTANVVGGTAPYTFQIIAPSTINSSSVTGASAIFNALSAGTYTIKVTDSKACTYQENYTINPITPISVTGTVTSNVKCFGGNTGAVTFNVSGFTGTYSYSINNGTAVTNQTAATIPLTNLTIGSYSITVTDSVTNCPATFSLTVSGPASALALSATPSQPTCVATGSVNAIATGGWGSYQYTLTLPNASTVGPQISGLFTNLTVVGNYTVSVSDANGCIVTKPFSINSFSNPTLAISPTSNLCYNTTSGSTVVLTAGSGTPPYQYKIGAGAFQSSNTFTNLTPGSYTFNVVDSYGCTASVNQVINPLLVATASITKNLDCTTNGAAIINVTVNGGVAPYKYQVKFNSGSWGSLVNFTGTSFSYSTSTAGNYQFQITDDKGCVTTTNVVTVAPLVQPVITSVIQSQPILCNGNSNGAITINYNNTVGLAPFTISVLNTTTNNNYGTQTSGLPAGSYLITLTDANSCSDTETIILTQPAVLAAQAAITQQITCLVNGTIQANNVTGGTTPYQYSLNGVAYQSSNIFTNLAAGTYTITVKDANNCTVQTNAVTLTTPAPITDLSFTSTAVICPALNSNVTVTSSGGVAPFTFQIIAPSTINSSSTTANVATFNALNTGTYIFKVTDSNGCTYQENFTINPPTFIAVNGSTVSNVSCLGNANGVVTFTVSGFSTSYSYTVNGGAPVTNQTNPSVTLNNLLAGNYIINVTDTTTNCPASVTLTVTSPATALSLTKVVSPITCVANGNVVGTAIGGWGSYQYTLTLPNASTVGPQISGSFGNLTLTGNYTLSVKDGNNCIVTTTFTLSPVVNPVVTIATSSTLCYNTATGSTVVLAASGGVAPYSYNVNGGTNQSSNIFTNLTPGSYTFNVVDSYGCTTSVNQVINPLLVATASITKNLDCTSSPNATINVAITGGVAPYKYQVKFNSGSWGSLVNFTGTSFSYSTSTAGNYQFQITDDKGCVTTTNVVTIIPITSPDIVSLTQTQSNLCNGNSNAAFTINMNPNLGVSPFVFTVINTTTGVNYGAQTSGLPAGNYTVSVVDANQCTDTASITITQPNPIVFTVNTTDISCSGTGGTNFGQIKVVSVSGGTMPYTYHISNNFGYTDTYNTITNEDHTFIVLNFGVYHVQVIDANGCVLVGSDIIIASPPNDLNIDVSTPTVSCLTGGTAIITVSTAVLSGSYEFGILTSNSSPYATVFQPADSGTPETTTFSGLTPGVLYTFVVHDLITNCYYFETAASPILSPSSITANINTVNNVTCTGSSNGTVSFTITGHDVTATSVSYEIFNAQSNSTTGFTGTSLNTGSSITVNNFATLSPGLYYLLVTENGGANTGCTSATTNFSITQSVTLLNANASLIKNDNCNLNAGIVSASAVGGTAPYQYQILASTATTPTVSTWAGSSTNIFNVESGNYIVYVKDANDCIQSATITVGLDLAPSIALSLPLPCVAEGTYAVQVVRTNGIAPFTYSVDGGASFTENNASFSIPNLSSGTHLIVVTDANGCIDNTQSITILPKVTGTATAVQQPSCANTDGVIQATASNGGGIPYSFTLQDNLGNPLATNATGLFSGLGFGNYSIVITDPLTCSITVTASLEQPAPVTFTNSFVNPTCNGLNNGSITVTLDATDTNPPYLYSLDNGVTTQSSPIFNNLLAGSYTITVISGRNCRASQTVNLVDPAVLDVTATATTFACNSANTVNTVTITATPTGGTSPYLFSIDGTNYQSSNQFIIADNGLVQPFTVYVKDANSCTDTFPITINPLPVMTTPLVSLTTGGTSYSCSTPETVTVTVSGGSGSFNYQLLPSGTASPTNTFTLTAPGSYTFQITDTTTGCTINTAPYTINTLPTAIATATVVSNVDCFGNSTGSIQLNVSGYTGSYSYDVYQQNGTLLSSGTNASTLVSALAAGSYYFTVTETQAPFCNTTSNVVTIGTPSQALAVSLQQTNDVNCRTTNSGTITATATSGTAPYQFQLMSGATILQAYAAANVFTTLDTGNYTVNVKDANNCIQSASITVGLDLAPSIALSLPLPCAAEGTYAVQVVRTNGIAPFTYSVDGGATFTENNASFSIPNLSSGTHLIVVTDANGCIDNTQSITILPKVNGTAAAVQQPSCANTDGIIQATATSGGGIPYSYTLQNTTGTTIATNATGLFSGLGFGNYTIIITDPLTCSVSVAASLEQPAPVTFTNSFVNPTCNGLNNGSITIALDATDTNPPYLYSLDNGVTTQSSPIFNNLIAGSYTITVISGRNCRASQTVNLVDPAVLDVTATATTFACNSANTVNTVTITATPTGGTSPYLFSIDGTNYQSATTFSVADNGLVQNLTVHVKDANSCTDTFPITINPLPVMSAPLVSLTLGGTSYTCTTPETVTVTVTGGSGNFDYLLLPSGTASSNNNFILTAPGSYTFQIIDKTTGCTINTAPYIINPLPILDVQANAVSAVNCFGDTNGSLSFSVLNYFGNYNYQVFDASTGLVVANGSGSTLSSLVTVTGLPAGNFYVTLTETQIPQCVANSNVVTIGSPAIPMILTIQQTAPVTCSTNNQGTITAQTIGGNGTYQYQLINISTGTTVQAFNSNATFSGLPAGNFEVTVRDQNLCTDVKLITLSAPTPITAINAITNQNLSCYNATNASVTVTATGGQGTYQYTLNLNGVAITGSQSNNVFTNLGAGANYTVTITDGWDCTFTTLPFTITQPTQIIASLTQQSPLTCFTNAQLLINASGGTPPYKYGTDGINFIPLSTTPISVGAGTYHYYVTDANNCTAILTNDILIEPIAPLQLILDTSNTSINCNGDANASLSATVVGGLGNYQFSLLNASNTVIQGPQSGSNFTSLGIGTYSIKVTSGDCTLISNSVLISQPPIIANAVTKTDISCHGLKDGSISINVAGGTPLFQYAITPNLSQTSNNSTFSNLGPGSYDVLIQDSNGCFRIVTSVITEPAELTSNIASFTEELCEGNDDGSITITITGGTPPYFTSLDNNTPGSYTPAQLTYSGLSGDSSHTYIIYVKDSKGCETAVPKILNTPVTLNPVLNTIVYGCATIANLNNNTVTVSGVSAAIQASVTYSLDNTTSYQSNNVYTNLANGNHIIYVKHTNGCVKQLPFTITNYTPIVGTISSVNVLCNGTSTGSITVSGVSGGSGSYQYAISPGFIYGSSTTFTNLVAGTYTVKIKDTNSCEFTFPAKTITENSKILVTDVQILQENCVGDNDGYIKIGISNGVGPYSTSLNNQTNFIAGQIDFFNLNGGQTYTIYVKDALGCIVSHTVILNPPVDMHTSAYTSEVCIGNVNTIQVTIQVDQQYINDVLYSINGVNFQQSNIFTNLAPGNYTGYVLHNLGCLSITTPFTINQISQLNLTAVESGLNQITATATFGSPPYAYYFNGEYQGSNNVFLFSQTAVYTIKVIDNSGCEKMVTLPATFYDIEIPNYFTPDGNNHNDGWSPRKIDNFYNIKTKIFDRYGRVIKILSLGETWDGTYNNEPLPSGDYWYLVEVNDDSGRTFVGNFTLYR